MKGFLGTPASFFPDFVVVAMFLVLPAFFYGMLLLRKGQRKAHAWVMGTVFGVLFVTVVAFVIWARFYNDYRVTWEDTPFYKNVFMPFVYSHIAIALLGLASGTLTVISGLSRARSTEAGEFVIPSPGARKAHIWAGRLSLVLFILIAFSGFGIYYFRYIFSGPS